MASRPFSGSSGGRGIEITDTATPGQLIDASTASKTNRYRFLATNRDSVARKLSITWRRLDGCRFSRLAPRLIARWKQRRTGLSFLQSRGENGRCEGALL